MKNFSDSYERLVEMKKALGEEDLENHLMEWARDVINTLHKVHKDAWFKVMITLDPNPLDCKGMDQCKIEIKQTEHYKDPGFRPFNKYQSSHYKLSDCLKEINESYKLSDCLKEINERLDEMLSLSKETEIIEKDGKKYRLVEVK